MVSSAAELKTLTARIRSFGNPSSDRSVYEDKVHPLAAVGAFVVLSGFKTGAVVAQTGAQQPPPVRVLVTTTQVKPGMAADYRAIIQSETIPANKKAGVPWRWVFQSGPLSGQAGLYLTVTPVTNFAQFDGPNPMQRALGTEGAAKVNARIQATIVSTHSVLQTLIANASLQSYSSTPPPLIRVQEIDLIAGKGGDFTTLLTQSYLPALKKAGVTDYLVFTTSYGGAGNHAPSSSTCPSTPISINPAPSLEPWVRRRTRNWVSNALS
jgi:hypothetical protein